MRINNNLLSIIASSLFGSPSVAANIVTASVTAYLYKLPFSAGISLTDTTSASVISSVSTPLSSLFNNPTGLSARLASSINFPSVVSTHNNAVAHFLRLTSVNLTSFVDIPCSTSLTNGHALCSHSTVNTGNIPSISDLIFNIRDSHNVKFSNSIKSHILGLLISDTNTNSVGQSGNLFLGNTRVYSNSALSSYMNQIITISAYSGNIPDDPLNFSDAENLIWTVNVPTTSGELRPIFFADVSSSISVSLIRHHTAICVKTGVPNFIIFSKPAVSNATFSYPASAIAVKLEGSEFDSNNMQQGNNYTLLNLEFSIFAK